MGNYLNYLKNLEYPEYVHKEKKSGKSSLILLDFPEMDRYQIPDKIYQAIKDGTSALNKYSFSQNPELLELISEYTQVDKDNILITAGGDGGLRIVAQALIENNTPVCIPLPSFGRFEYHTRINGGRPQFIAPAPFPYDLDLPDISQFCHTNKSEVIFLANPNNPTGIFKSTDQIEHLLQNFQGYLILDEALVDYVDKSCASLLSKYPNLIIVRSFSKLFSIPSMRIGYLMASSQLIKSFRVLVSPFEVSIFSILFGIEALRNRDEFITEKRHILSESLTMIEQSKGRDYQISPTCSSVLVIRSPKPGNLYENLQNRGVRTVSCKDFRGLENENSVRISIKNIQSIRKFLKILKQV